MNINETPSFHTLEQTLVDTVTDTTFSRTAESAVSEIENRHHL